MRFEVKTRTDGRAISAFQHAAAATVARRKNLFTRLTFVIIGAVFLVTTGVAMAGGDPPTAFRVLGVVLGVLFVALGICYTRFAAWQAGRGRKGEAPEITYTFVDEGFALTDGKASEKHGYNQIYALCESGAYFFLFMDARTGFILDKQGFTQGTAEAFRAFLAGRTDKEMTACR